MILYSKNNNNNKKIIIVGIDPGPEKIGWGAVTMVYDGTGETYDLFYKDGGWQESTIEGCEFVIGHGDVIGVESVRGYSYDKFRTAHLLDTNFVAGQCFGIATLREKVVYDSPATVVRKHLYDNFRAPDNVIKEMLPLYVKNMPKQSNVHQRDGLSVAVYVAYCYHTGNVAPGKFNGNLQGISKTTKPIKKNVRGQSDRNE